ncbi:phosphohydrolase [Meiothermus hypogaeus NBRC 106114]|uniref:Phosphohydrolase n=3 Tax=Meiothermus hypogaeus TaxID=884155 RepID=A0A511R2G5_9DEIN|nr:HD-GYP domain-containing protein [Meiothermus hypogaeus]RIH79681.1 Cyclic di-GMP phosphodiesterase response regulator RpfG [Meiothermus hypogaeus]GEM83810.1 phosphohydrolase [Meiothermus hypogaeus NBRC 106114]
MSHAFVVNIAAVTFFPLWLAPVLVFVLGFNKDFGRPEYPWYKDLFNRTQSALATGMAAWVWWLVQQASLNPDLGQVVGVLAASVVYFLINVSTVTYVIHLSSGASIRKIWFENYSWLWVSYLVQAPVGLLLAKAYQTPLIGGWGGFTVLFMMLLLYFSRYYWDEKVKLEESFDETIELLVSTIDAKDPFTRLHSERVAAIAASIAQRMGFDEHDVKRITYAARIHDIGKVAIPDSILLKPGKLSEDEFTLIKSHASKGLEVLQPMRQRLSKDVQGVIMHHHERWDGAGYPGKLKGEAIPLWARIVSLADAYEAMTAGRAYSRAKTPQEALNEIIMLAGKQFDPQIVKLFEALWLEDPIWKDREEFLRRYTSPAHLSGLSSPSRSGPASATLHTSS